MHAPPPSVPPSLPPSLPPPPLPPSLPPRLKRNSTSRKDVWSRMKRERSLTTLKERRSNLNYRGKCETFYPTTRFTRAILSVSVHSRPANTQTCSTRPDWLCWRPGTTMLKYVALTHRTSRWLDKAIWLYCFVSHVILILASLYSSSTSSKKLVGGLVRQQKTPVAIGSWSRTLFYRLKGTLAC